MASMPSSTSSSRIEVRQISYYAFSFFSNYYTSHGRVLSTNSPCNVADEEAVTRTRT